MRTFKRSKRGESKLLPVQSEAGEAQDFNCDLRLISIRLIIYTICYNSMSNGNEFLALKDIIEGIEIPAILKICSKFALNLTNLCCHISAIIITY